MRRTSEIWSLGCGLGFSVEGLGQDFQSFRRPGATSGSIPLGALLASQALV